VLSITRKGSGDLGAEEGNRGQGGEVRNRPVKGGVIAKFRASSLKKTAQTGTGAIH